MLWYAIPSIDGGPGEPNYLAFRFSVGLQQMAGSRTEAIARLPGSSILMCMDNQQFQVCALTCTLNIFQTRCSLWRAASSLAEGHSTKRSHFMNVIKHAPLLSWCLDLRLSGMSHRDRWFDNVWQREDRRPKANFMLKFDSPGVMLAVWTISSNRPETEARPFNVRRFRYPTYGATMRYSLHCPCRLMDMFFFSNHVISQISVPLYLYHITS